MLELAPLVMGPSQEMVTVPLPEVVMLSLMTIFPAGTFQLMMPLTVTEPDRVMVELAADVVILNVLPGAVNVTAAGAAFTVTSSLTMIGKSTPVTFNSPAMTRSDVAAPFVQVMVIAPLEVV